MGITNVYRFSGYLLLIMIFMVKVGVPVFKACNLSLKTPISFFESETQDGASKTEVKEKPELSLYITLNAGFSNVTNVPSIYFKNITPFLPARYCAVPTPPPWVRS